MATQRFNWYGIGPPPGQLTLTPTRNPGFNMVPSFSPGVIGGANAPAWPSLPGFSSTKNNTGGYNYSFAPSPPTPVTAAPKPKPTVSTMPVMQPDINLLRQRAQGIPPPTTATSNGVPLPTGAQGALPPAGLDPQIQALIDYTQAQSDKANAANEARYQQALQKFEGQGASDKADVAQNAKNAKAVAAQNLISRGLYNSTIQPTIDMGIDRETNRQNQRIDEGVARNLVDIIQSKQEVGPDQNFIAQLLRDAINKPDPALAAGGLPNGMTMDDLLKLYGIPQTGTPAQAQAATPAKAATTGVFRSLIGGGGGVRRAF